MKLYVGLGNPGREYAHTRHNAGFWALDMLASHYAAPPWQGKFASECTTVMMDGEKTLLLKPQTYMNRSGHAVQQAMAFYKIPLEDVTVFHDELDLAPGVVRTKTGGGAAGHNGLKSLDALVGYRRVRIGIGHPGVRELVTPHVLGKPEENEATEIQNALKTFCNL